MNDIIKAHKENQTTKQKKKEFSMKKFVKVVMSAAVVAAIGGTMAAGLTACNGGEEITISGSTSVQPLMEVLAGKYEELHSDVSITVSGGGSGVGVTDAQQGKVDFGMASRDLKDDETGVVADKIAIDGIALVVHPNCAVTNVTKAEVKALYEDKTAIQGVITQAEAREDGSGTRDAFEELIEVTKLYANMPEISSTGTVKADIAANTDGNMMGYISLGSVDSTVKALSYEGVVASVENVKNSTYKLSRNSNIIYKEDGLSDAAKAFIDFIKSEEGQKIVTDEGYITIL